MSRTDPNVIRIGHSPDPDDAFMFYALAHEKIDMRGFKVEHVIEDIESLNQRALRGELEVTAASCHAYAYLADQYAVMRSGASVGENYGPVLVRRTEYDIASKNYFCDNFSLSRTPYPVLKVAVPGELTTAYLVFQLYSKSKSKSPYPVPHTPYEVVFTPFDQIMGAVKNNEADYGLIIHEGQITYEQHGLELAADLGKWWHEHTDGLPLPLGVDIIRKDLGQETMRSFAVLFKESIQYGLTHRKEALQYALQYGRGIKEDLNDRFVGMYVNDYTVELGARGEAGFRVLLDQAFEHKIIPHRVSLEFI